MCAMGSVAGPYQDSLFGSEGQASPSLLFMRALASDRYEIGVPEELSDILGEGDSLSKQRLILFVLVTS